MSHLNCLDCFQVYVEGMCGLIFPSLTKGCSTSILGLTCHLLAGEGWGNLQSFHPTVSSNPLLSGYLLCYTVLTLQVVFCFKTLATFTPMIDSTVVGKMYGSQFLQIFCYKETVTNVGLLDVQKFIMM